jgi:hypothetical protein
MKRNTGCKKHKHIRGKVSNVKRHLQFTEVFPRNKQPKLKRHPERRRAKIGNKDKIIKEVINFKSRGVLIYDNVILTVSSVSD